MRLTAEHERALKAAREGTRRDQLGDLITSHEFVDLINWQLVRCEHLTDAVATPFDVWHLTPAGAAALESANE